MKSKRRLFFSLLLVCSAVGLEAAPDNTGGQGAYTFRAVAWNREVPDIHYLSGQKQQRLELHCGVISEKMRCDGDGKLTLWAGPVPKGSAASREPLATLSLQPEPAGNLVIMWVDKKERPQAIVLPDGPESLAAGQARLVNVTRCQLSIQCNGELMMLGPGATKIVPGDGRGVRLKVAMQKNNTGEWVLAAMNSVRVRPDTRVSVFIADPAEMAVPPDEKREKREEIPSDKLSLFVVADRVGTPAAAP